MSPTLRRTNHEVSSHLKKLGDLEMKKAFRSGGHALKLFQGTPFFVTPTQPDRFHRIRPGGMIDYEL
jgi:hypothetical protein